MKDEITNYYRMGVTDPGDILARSAVLHGQRGLVDQLTSALKFFTKQPGVKSCLPLILSPLNWCSHYYVVSSLSTFMLEYKDVKCNKTTMQVINFGPLMLK